MTLKPLLLSSAALTALLVAACSSTTGSSGGSSTSACNEYFDVVFAPAARCGSGVTVAPSEEARVRARFVSVCEKALTAPGQGITAAFLTDCSAKLKAAPCGSDFEDLCKPPAGTLENGAACGDDSQCKSRECKKASGTACGKCEARIAVGQPCDIQTQACVEGAVCSTKSGSGVCESQGPKLKEGEVCFDPTKPGSSLGQCDTGLRCNLENVGPNAEPAKCAPRGGVGAACTSAAECRTELTCVDKKCAAPPGEGAACTPGSRCATGLACDATARKCAKIVYAKAGEVCDLSGPRRCEKGSCKPPAGGDSITGTCADPIPDGAACKADGEDQCDVLASCIEGKCQIPDASQCK